MPTAQIPQSARNEGAGHFRQRASKESERGKKNRPDRQTDERVRDAAMPGEHEQFVFGKPVAEYVGVWEDGTENERPGDDAPPGHGGGRKEIVAVESGFSDESTGDAVSDGVHGSPEI